MDLEQNQNTTGSNKIMFNGNEITVGNIVPKKSTIQLLMEISTEMDTLSSHIEKTLPCKPINNYNILNNNINNNIVNNSYSIIANLDKEDLEIKKLINKANELSNNSISRNKKI